MPVRASKRAGVKVIPYGGGRNDRHHGKHHFSTQNTTVSPLSFATMDFVKWGFTWGIHRRDQYSSLLEVY